MEPILRITCSRGLGAFLAARRLSLAVTSYRTGKLFLIGHRPDGRLAIHERSFDRAMGLWAATDARSLHLATRFQIWRLVDALAEGPRPPGLEADRLYVPRVAWTTGELDVHDMVCEADGRLLFAATRMNLVATMSEEASFVPVWKPRFISALVPEDRCHLNGLALRDGHARYATAVARSDVVEGWRDFRGDGGVVVDIRDDSIIAEGLAMPHSPRWHDGALWLLESGRGRLVRIDPDRGTVERLLFLPGYARGLAFHDGHAFIGLSLPRSDDAFRGLPLEEELQRRRARPRCGVLVVELARGVVVEWLTFEGIVRELYDVAVLPGVRRPRAVGLRGEEIGRVITVGRRLPATAAAALP